MVKTIALAMIVAALIVTGTVAHSADHERTLCRVPAGRSFSQLAWMGNARLAVVQARSRLSIRVYSVPSGRTEELRRLASSLDSLYDTKYLYNYRFSPDGERVLIATGGLLGQGELICNTDGSRIEEVPTPSGFRYPSPLVWFVDGSGAGQLATRLDRNRPVPPENVNSTNVLLYAGDSVVYKSPIDINQDAQAPSMDSGAYFIDRSTMLMFWRHPDGPTSCDIARCRISNTVRLDGLRRRITSPTGGQLETASVASETMLWMVDVKPMGARRVRYGQRDRARCRLYVSDLTGAEMRLLSDREYKVGDLGSTRLSPDGKRVAVIDKDIVRILQVPTVPPGTAVAK